MIGHDCASSGETKSNRPKPSAHLSPTAAPPRAQSRVHAGANPGSAAARQHSDRRPLRIPSAVMLDPRIYRTGLVVVALAVVVLAFSLQNQPGALSSSLAPDAFNGQNVYANMTSMAADAPDRRPGSAGDYALAAQVTKSFRSARFSVSTDA